MIGDEFKDIITNGEFASSNNGQEVIMIHDSVEDSISCIIEHGWKRTEVDGVLTTDIPRESLAFLVSEDALPINIVFLYGDSVMIYEDETLGIYNGDLNDITFKYQNKEWKTLYAVGLGHGMLSFQLVEKDDLTTVEDEVVYDDNAPGLIV